MPQGTEDRETFALFGEHNTPARGYTVKRLWVPTLFCWLHSWASNSALTRKIKSSVCSLASRGFATKARSQALHCACTGWPVSRFEKCKYRFVIAPTGKKPLCTSATGDRGRISTRLCMRVGTIRPQCCIVKTITIFFSHE